MRSPVRDVATLYQKPVGPAQINWNDSIARGLSFATVLTSGQGYPVELVRGKLMALNGGAAWTPSPEGVQVSLPSASSSYVATTDTPSDAPFLGAITILYRGKIATGSAFREITSKQAGNGATNSPFDFRADNSATPLLQFIRASGTLFNTFTGPSTTLNKTQTYAVSSPNGDISTAPTFYVDGVGSTAGAGGNAGACTGSTSNIWIGRRPDGGTQMDGSAEMLFIWNRALTSAEVGLISRDPYRLIREAPSSQTWFTLLFSAPPGLTSGTLTLGATGATTQALSLATNTGGTAPYSNQLQQSTNGGTTWTNVGAPVAGATASWTVTGLTPGQAYQFRVNPVTDSASGSATSNTVSVTIPQTTVTSPGSSKVVANQTNVAVEVTGNATWASGTIWSVTGLTGAAVTSKTFIDATHYRLYITTSTVDASGTLTLSNSTDSSTATLTVLSSVGGASRRRPQ